MSEYEFLGRLIAEREIIPPAGEWEPKSVYLVEVSWNRGNPVYPSLFYSGFLLAGQPAQYNCVWHPADEGRESIELVHFLRVVRKLDVDLYPELEGKR